MIRGRYRRVALIAAILGIFFQCVASNSKWNISSHESFSLASDDDADLNPDIQQVNIDPSTENVDYKDFCTMSNMFIATRGYKHRFAYGLTFECLFFFFDIAEYPVAEILFDYFQLRYDLVGDRIKKVCPVDLFEIKYVSIFPKPYFEILDLKAGTSTQVSVTKGSFYFYHYTPSSLHTNWQATRGRWTSHYHSLLLHHLSFNSTKHGRGQVNYYIRHNNELHPGACFAETHGSTALLYQIRLVLGTEAVDLNSFMEDGIVEEETVTQSVTHYYFWGIIGEMILCGVTLAVCALIMFIKITQYYRIESCRREVEKFVVSCYVEKLEKLSKLSKPRKHRKSKPKKVETVKKAESPKKSSPKKKKKKKKSRSSSSRSHSHHHHHHHRKCHSESDKIPQGSKLIPLPLEKDLFASDKPKVKAPSVKPKLPDKVSLSRHSRESSKGSLCSLKSVTEDVENSFDWTSKGVKLSKRPLAIELYKRDLEKDEDEAYKLGINVSSLKRKRRLEQKAKETIAAKPSDRATDTPSVIIKTMSHDLKHKKEEEAQLDKMQKAKAAAAAAPVKPHGPAVTPPDGVLLVRNDGAIVPATPPSTPSTAPGPYGSLSIPPSTNAKKQD